jgi:cytochrome c-type biogenesis protein CcmH/NrfG
MAQQKFPKAYEAYQQAVYRDGRNPTFWCSIGVLYYQINQYRDALDAYSRAIRLNPYISEVWYDLGTLVRYPSFIHEMTSADEGLVRKLQQPDRRCSRCVLQSG